MCTKLVREVEVYGNYLSYDDFANKRGRVRAAYHPLDVEVYFKVVKVDHPKKIITVHLDHCVDPAEFQVGAGVQPDGWAFSISMDGTPYVI